MQSVDINDIATIGAVRDSPPYMLPPEAWTTALNMRVVDGGLERMLGWDGVFGTLATGNDSFTKVLLHFDGADAGTIITDTNSGGGAHVWTAAGNANTDDAQKKFGATSLGLDGTGDWVTTPDSADFTLGSGAWTVDLWFNCNAAGGVTSSLAGQSDNALLNTSISFILYRSSANVIVADVQVGATLSRVTGTTQFTNAVNTGWHHVALVRTGNILRLFIDGLQEGGDVAITGTVNNSANALRVGALGEFVTSPWTGWIDEFRLSVGVARWTAAFNVPTREYQTTAEATPEFLMPVSTSTTNFWLYASLTKIHGYDGTTHTDLTRLATGVNSPYTVTNGYDWNGTLLGGIPILNNGADIPQFWATPSLGTRMANLTNWTSTMRAKIVRAFGPFLMAFNITDSGTSKPHLVRWSHPADPGSVPSSWDVTDDTKDTGQVDLPDTNAGIILEALPLGSIMYIFKENSIHRAKFVGGRAIFDFGDGAWLPNIGILAARCAAVTGDGQRMVWASQDDLLWHDGNRANSLLNKRQKKRLSNEIDSANFSSSFIFSNPYYNEMWFCYPSSGQSFPDRALVLNYGETGDWVITEADGITFRHAAVGLVESPSSETWEDNPAELWDDDTGPWATMERRRVVLAGTSEVAFFKMDSGATRNGVAHAATLGRESLSIIGKKRSGEWIVDHQAVKYWDRHWPKIQGGPVNFRVGTQELVNGPISWGTSVVFDPSTSRYADVNPCSGASLSLEYSTVAAVAWRIDGYKFDVEVIAEH